MTQQDALSQAALQADTTPTSPPADAAPVSADPVTTAPVAAVPIDSTLRYAPPPRARRAPVYVILSGRLRAFSQLLRALVWHLPQWRFRHELNE